MIFKFLQNSQRNTSPEEFVYDQAVIIDIDLNTIDEFGSKEDRNGVDRLEEHIEKLLPPRAGVDGHEFGEGTATVYVYGSDADKLYQSITPALQASDFHHITITLQYGPPDDPNTKDKKFSF